MMVRILFPILALFLILPCAVPASAPVSVVSLLRQAKVETARNHLDIGLSLLDKALDLDPGYMPLWREKARILFQKNQPLQAIEAINTVLSVNPQDREANLILFQILMHTPSGNVETFDVSLDRFLNGMDDKSALDVLFYLLETPENKTALANVARQWRPTSRKLRLMAESLLVYLSEDLRAFNRSIDALAVTGPGNRALAGRLCFLIGKNLLDKGDYETALAQFQKTMDLGYDPIATQGEIGWVYFGQGKTVQAEALWKKFWREASNVAAWVQWIAKAAEASKDYPVAAEFYQKSLQFQPENVLLQGKYGLSLLMKGDENAYEAFEAHMMEKGSLDAVLFSRAFYLKNRGNIEAAVNALKKIRNRKPFQNEFSAFGLELATTPVPAGEVDRRLAMVLFLVEDISKQLWILRDIGWAYWSQSQFKSAITVWDKAIDSGLTNPEPLIHQAVFRLVEVGHVQEALDFLDRRAPNISYLGLAYSMIDASRFDLAARVLTHLDPNQPDLFPELYRARCSIENNEPVSAIASLRKIHQQCFPAPTTRITTFGSDEHFITVTLTSDDALTVYTQIADAVLKKKLTDAFFFLSRPSWLPDFPQQTSAAFQAEAGAILLHMDRKAEAREFFESALALDPDNAKARIYHMMIAKRPFEVTKWLEESHDRVEPYDLEYVRGQIALMEGNPTPAIESFQKCLDIRPSDESLRLKLISLLVDMSRFMQAAQCASWFEQALAQGDKTVRASTAVARLALGNPSGAIAIWQTLLNEHPESLNYLAGIGRALNKSNRYADTLRMLSPAFNKTGAPALAVIMCEADMALGKPRDAFRHAVKGLVSTPDDPTLIRIAAESAAAVVDLPSAEHYARRYIALNPDSPKMQNLLGRLLLDQNKLDAAEQHFQSLLERTPGYEASLRGLLSVDQISGDAPGALRYAGMLKDIFPDDLGIRLKYGIAAAGDKKFKTAYTALKPMNGLGTKASVLTLYYPEILDVDAPGKGRFSQWEAHMRALHAAKATFLVLDDFVMMPERGRLTLSVEKRNDQPSVMVMVGSVQKTVIWQMDQVLKEIDGRALIVVDENTLAAGSPYVMDRAELTEILSTGRWFPVLTDNTPPAIQLPNGTTGKFWGQALPSDTGIETEPQMTGRLMDRMALLKQKALGIDVGAWLYPDGLSPNAILDVREKDRMAAHQAVAENFDIAFMSSPEGFWTPMVAPLTFPVRFVPPAWTESNLMEHLWQKDPQRLVVLSLAKINSWHDQLERADLFFRAAKGLDLDPIEVNSGHGANAFFQGDIPTALNMVRTAVDLNPESERNRHLLKRIEGWTHPLVEGTTGILWDSDDRQFLRTGIGGAAYARESLMLFARMGWLTWRYDENSIRNLRRIEGYDLVGGARCYLTPGYWLDAEAGLTGFSDGRTSLASMGLSLHGPMATDVWGINGTYDIKYAFERIDTIEAVTEKIQNHHLSLMNHLRILDFWELWANAHAMLRTDGNDTFMMEGRFVRRICEVPSFSAGYAFQFANSKEDPPEYWAPLDLVANLAYASLAHRFANKLRFTGSTGVGLSKSRNKDWHDVWRLNLKVNYDLTETFRFNLRYSYYSAPDYALNQLWAELSCRF